MDDIIRQYIVNLQRTLDSVLSTQSGALMRGAQTLCGASLNGRNIFAFGCGHAGLLALELYYRTGGMATINPIRAPGLCLDVDPATMTSQMERLEGYGRVIVDNQPVGGGDVVIVHSVSGRNAVTVDVALRCREKGAYVIALTNMQTTTRQASRHPCGQNLYQVADLALDNCGCLGDSSLAIDGVPEKVGPTSTAVGAAMLNAMIAQAVALIAQTGAVPPVFVSANLDGGDEHNQRVLEQYREHIFYMGR
jgi:uncharacterized phosphosugar-binding protein